MPRKYEPKGPTVRRQFACAACGHWQFGKSHYHVDKPVAFRDVIYSGDNVIRVSKRGDYAWEYEVDEKGKRVKDEQGQWKRHERQCQGTVYIDEVDSYDLVTQARAIIGRLAEAIGLWLDHDAKLRTQLDKKTQEIAQLQRVLARLSDAPGAGTHQKRRRVKRKKKPTVNPMRMSGLTGIDVRRKSRPVVARVREDELLERPRSVGSFGIHLGSTVRTGAKVITVAAKEDSLGSTVRTGAHVTTGVVKEDGL